MARRADLMQLFTLSGCLEIVSWTVGFGIVMLLFVAALPVNSDAAPVAGTKPNFVIFLVDDMGWSDPACYANSFHETPHIDRFAAQGLKFTSAYAACPVCSPTRASVVTGRYPASVGITDFIPGHRKPWAKLKVPAIHQALPESEVTFAEMLEDVAYVSGAFGKWHLGNVGSLPQDHGFNEQLVSKGQHFAPKFKTTPPADLPDGTYLADALTDRAIAFLKAHREERFCLYLAHYAVHIPLQAKADTIAKYTQKTPKPDGRVNNPTYAAMVEHVDDSLGRIMATLAELKLDENTVVFFLSDNGGLYKTFTGKGPAVMRNTPLRDEKGSLYEGGIRIPWIVRWPGKIAAGRVCNEPISTVDIWPTLADLSGVKCCAQPDGVSLVPLFEGKESLDREAIYWHYPHYHHTTPAGAIRRGDWKLIEYFEDNRVELYNVTRDISESQNLAMQHPDRAKAMRKQLAAWRKSVNAKMPTANPEFDAKKADEWGTRRRR